MELYQANLELAQAFHPLLGSFEVILRNQLHYALAAHFNDKEWIINQIGLPQIHLVKITGQTAKENNGKFKPLAAVNRHQTDNIFLFTKRTSRPKVTSPFPHPVNEAKETEDAAEGAFLILTRSSVERQ